MVCRVSCRWTRWGWIWPIRTGYLTIGTEFYPRVQSFLSLDPLELDLADLDGLSDRLY